MNKKLINKVSTAVVSFTTVVMLSGAGALLPMSVHGATLEEQIQALLSQIAVLQAQLAAQEPAGGTADTSLLASSKDLTLGSKGPAVKALQQYLNANGAQVSASGAGSPGNETETFGSKTKAALAKWQAANGVSPAAGYFGPKTRAKMTGTAAAPAPALGGTTPAPAPVVVVPQGTGLTVTLASDQPVATLAPADAARIPFTKVLLTASLDGDVTVTGLEVERTGLAADAALDSVVLLDDAGNQLGLKKTLSSEHKATIGEAMTVKAGQTKSVMVAANRAAAASAGGQTLALRVTKVNTSAKVNGALPLTGTTHTINETLTIGSVTMARGPLDPGASQTKEIGTNNYTFSAIRVTAGSAEKIYLKSVRWNQTGSAGASDLANVKTYVDGTGYDTTLSADGKYYSSVFPGTGILIDKGFNKEFSVKGDVVGGSSRKIDFDVAKRTDVYVVGETYGYGIIPPQTGSTDPTDDTAAFSNTEDPWYDAADVHISSGTMTVSADNAVAAQNIAINLADQPLGGWSVDVKGEQISVGSIKMHFQLTQDSSGSTGLGLDDLDNVKLIDATTGKTLAGPVDPTSTALGTNGTANLTFTDTITFPVGVTRMKMVGKLAAGTAAFENNDTLVASTTPSTDWGTVTGQTTGVTVTPSPTSKVAGQTMTAKGPAVTISVSSVPIAQTVIAGLQQFEFAKYILDTAASGEDLRLTSLPLEYNIATGGATDLTNCKLYDGATALTTGGNAVNPSARGSSTSFTFDGTGLTLTKGVSKQLSLKCDLKSAATGSYRWGYDSTSAPDPTGLVSGQSATVTENDSMGQLMTAAANGTLTVNLDTAGSYTLASPGETVDLIRLKYSATNEDVSIKQVALQLLNAASNTPIDLVNQEVTLWDGATKLGTAVFSSGDYATSSAISGFTVPKDGSKVLTVKGTIAGISASGPVTQSGDHMVVDYDGDNVGLNGNYGTGLASGQTINGSTPDTSDTASSSGIRVMKAYPAFEKLTLPDTTLKSQTELPIYRFKVTAKQGDISLYKFTFSVSSSTASASAATTSRFSLYAFTDSGFSTPDGNFSGTNNAGGLLNAGNCYNGHNVNTTNNPPAGSTPGTGGGNLGAGSAQITIVPDKTGCVQGTTTLKISSGESRWLELRASVGTLAPSGTAENLSVQLEGDAAFPVGNGLGGSSTQLGSAGNIDSDTNDDFIWSPRSTSTNESDVDYQRNADWTNGYGVTGLPATNMTATTLSK